MDRRTPVPATFLLCLLCLLPPAAAGEPGEDTLPAITLAEAEARALSRNPLLREGDLSAEAADALLFQAGRLPNPTVELEAENIAGNGPFRGTGAAEWTLSLAQVIPLGGKRAARRALSRVELDLARLAREERRLSVLAGTRAAFHRALVAQERVVLREEMLRLARRFAETVHRRVEAGRAAPVEGIRARVEVSRARTALARARRNRTAARAALAATWGALAPDFSRVRGNLPVPRAAPPWEKLLDALERTPAIRTLAARRARAAAAARRERVRAIPDPEFRVGARRFADTGDRAWIASAGIPLPVLDRNRGARRAARLGKVREELSARAARAELVAALRAVRARLAAAEEELASLRNEVVPSAEEAFRLVETGYREGKFGFIDVLDARRDLVAARELLLDAGLEVLLARVELDLRTADALRVPPGVAR